MSAPPRAPRNARGSPWSVEFDPNYRAYYYFNGVTGASEWIEDEEVLSCDAERVEIELTTLAVSQIEESKKKAKSNKKQKSKKSQKESTMVENSTDDDDDDDNGDQDDTAIDTNDGIELISDAARLAADTQGALNSHMRCLLVNACLCEAPLAAIEGLCRTAAFSLLVAISLLFAAFTMDALWVRRAKACAREALLTLAATFSLLVPFIVCFVYRRFDGDEDWDLAPLPTVLGWVDAQRFTTFALGGGSYAQQRPRERDFLPSDGDDAVPHGGGRSLLDVHEANSLDSWQVKAGGGPSILVAPRRVLNFFSRIARGDEAELQEAVRLGLEME